MNVLLRAAEQVLAEAEKPLHYRKITDCMLQRQLWMTQGKTPDQTVNARLSTDIQYYGTSSRFQRTDAGTFALRRWGLPEYPSNRTATFTALSPHSESNLSLPMPTRQTLSFTDAAEYVLEQFGNSKSMHYRDITEKALELGLLRTSGQTPEATLSSQIGTEIARQERRGELPRFVRHGKGKVSLSQWQGQEQPRELAKLIKQHNDEVRQKLHERLSTMNPAEFEGQHYRLNMKIKPGDFYEVTKALERLNDQSATMDTTVMVIATAKAGQHFNANTMHNLVVEPMVEESNVVVLEELLEE